MNQDYKRLGFYFGSKRQEKLAKSVRAILLGRLPRGSSRSQICSYFAARSDELTFVRDDSDGDIFCRCYEITQDGKDRIQYDLTFVLTDEEPYTTNEPWLKDITVDIIISRNFNEKGPGDVFRQLFGMPDDAAVSEASIRRYLLKLLPIGCDESFVEKCTDFFYATTDDQDSCNRQIEGKELLVATYDPLSGQAFEILFHALRVPSCGCLLDSIEVRTNSSRLTSDSMPQLARLLNAVPIKIHSLIPVNRDQTRRAITAFYHSLGLNPLAIIWCESPLQLLLAPSIIRKMQQGFELAAVRAEMTDAFRHAFDECVGSRIETSLWRLIQDFKDNEGGKSHCQFHYRSVVERSETEACQMLDHRYHGLIDDMECVEERHLSQNQRDVLRDPDAFYRDVPELWQLAGAPRRIGRLFLRSERDLLPDADTIIWGRWNSAPLFYFHYLQQFLPKPLFNQKLDAEYRLWSNLLEGAFAYRFFDDICFVCDVPVIQRFDDSSNLHHLSGCAVRFRDGYEVHAVHGVVVPRYVIEEPGRITVKDIETEPNVELRRIKLERYGESRYLQDSHAQLLDECAVGRLFRKVMPNDEPLVMVQVVNSTPEPDGSYRKYFLRVPPSTKTAAEAVAWTFGMNEEEYRPIVET